VASRKSPALPVTAAVASRIEELPGALFFGGLFRAERCQFSITRRHEENVEYAERLQEIRASYESDACEEALWDDCQWMGFSPKEISRFVANSAALTSCGYYGDPIPLR
jgi:hypothetical protein